MPFGPTNKSSSQPGKENNRPHILVSVTNAHLSGTFKPAVLPQWARHYNTQGGGTWANNVSSRLIIISIWIGSIWTSAFSDKFVTTCRSDIARVRALLHPRNSRNNRRLAAGL